MYLWDVESRASLFAGPPDEGGEGKELLISAFSPYLSSPAGAAARGRTDQAQSLCARKRKGNLHPKVPLMLQTTPDPGLGGKRAALRGLELPPPTQSHHPKVLQVQEPTNVFLDDISAPTYAHRPTEVSRGPRGSSIR